MNVGDVGDVIPKSSDRGEAMGTWDGLGEGRRKALSKTKVDWTPKIQSSKVASSQPPAAAARRQRMSSTVMAHHGRKLPFRYGRSSAEVTSGRISLTGTEVGEHIAAV